MTDVRTDLEASQINLAETEQDSLSQKDKDVLDNLQKKQEKKFRHMKEQYDKQKRAKADEIQKI